MREIVRVHNRIIPRSLPYHIDCDQWRQREYNFGGNAEGIKKHVARNKKDSLLTGRQRWRYRERRESLRSLCKTSGTIGFNENLRENDDDCG